MENAHDTHQTVENRSSISSEQDVTPESKKEVSKTKKKKAGDLGSLAVKPANTAVSKSEQRSLRTAVQTKRQLEQELKPSTEVSPEAYDEKLSDDEIASTYQKLAHELLDEAMAEKQGLTEGSDEMAQAEAAIVFNAKAEAYPDPNRALEETLAELDVTPEEVASLKSVLAREFSSSADIQMEAGNEAGADVEPSFSELLSNALEEHKVAESDDSEPHVISTETSTEAVPLGPSNLDIDTELIAQDAASEGAPPPQNPGIPFAAGGGNGGGRMPSNGFNANTTAPPVSLNPNAQVGTPAEGVYGYERRANARGLLVGGIVGYLIGRRRGRIKTEKRLLPVQRKLEKQVRSLQHDLIAKELLVRQVAAEHSRSAKVHAAADAIEQRVAVETPVSSSQQLTRRPELRSVAPEASQIHGKQAPLEHIGQVLIAAEAALPMLIEQRMQKPSERITEQPARERLVPKKPEVGSTEFSHSNPSEHDSTITKTVDTMGHAELLALSEKIIVDGATLRQVYETHLVGEKGLRRIVAEHLRGGEVKRVLRRELVEREIDFERDPMLRDRARASLSGGGKGKTALTSLLQQSGALEGDEAEDAIAVQESRAKYEETKAAKQHQHRKLADISLITTIAILAAIVIILLTVKR